MIIDRNELNDLLTAFQSFGLKAMEYEEAGFRVRFESDTGESAEKVRIGQTTQSVQSAQPNHSTQITQITSPIVGVYYESPSPGEDPYIVEGQTVRSGDIVCMIEAMKMMNEIKAEYDCRIIRKCAENGEMVEFGTVLFEVEKC